MQKPFICAEVVKLLFYLTFGRFQPCLIEIVRTNTITNPAIKATAPFGNAVGSNKT